MKCVYEGRRLKLFDRGEVESESFAYLVGDDECSGSRDVSSDYGTGYVLNEAGNAKVGSDDEEDSNK